MNFVKKTTVQVTDEGSFLSLAPVEHVDAGFRQTNTFFKLFVTKIFSQECISAL